MELSDKLLIRYDGEYDLSCIDQENKVAYTSIKTKSSSAMSKHEFKDYKRFAQDIYFYKSVFQDQTLNEETLNDINFHVQKQGLPVNVYQMANAFEKQYQESDRIKQDNIKLNDWVFEQVYDVIDCRIHCNKTHDTLSRYDKSRVKDGI